MHLFDPLHRRAHALCEDDGDQEQKQNLRDLRQHPNQCDEREDQQRRDDEGAHGDV
jgi:hypothetical protein